MKPDPKLKEFYIRASNVPLVGTLLFAPFLRSLWKISVWIDKKVNERTQNKTNEIQLSTYSSVIYTMQQRIEHLENQMHSLQNQVDSHFWKFDYRQKLDGAALDGIYSALAEERSTQLSEK